MIGLVRELLLPRTDAGVAVQTVAGTVGLVAALWLVRRHREARTFVVGLGVLLVALAALRVVH